MLEAHVTYKIQILVDGKWRNAAKSFRHIKDNKTALVERYETTRKTGKPARYVRTVTITDTVEEKDD